MKQPFRVFLEVHRGLEEVYNELLLINWNGEDRAQLQRAYTLSVLHTFSYDKNASSSAALKNLENAVISFALTIVTVISRSVQHRVQESPLLEVALIPVVLKLVAKTDLIRRSKRLRMAIAHLEALIRHHIPDCDTFHEKKVAFCNTTYDMEKAPQYHRATRPSASFLPVLPYNKTLERMAAAFRLPQVIESDQGLDNDSDAFENLPFEKVFPPAPAPAHWTPLALPKEVAAPRSVVPLFSLNLHVTPIPSEDTLAMPMQDFLRDNRTEQVKIAPQLSPFPQSTAAQQQVSPMTRDDVQQQPRIDDSEQFSAEKRSSTEPQSYSVLSYSDGQDAVQQKTTKRVISKTHNVSSDDSIVRCSRRKEYEASVHSQPPLSDKQSEPIISTNNAPFNLPLFLPLTERPPLRYKKQETHEIREIPFYQLRLKREVDMHKSRRRSKTTPRNEVILETLKEWTTQYPIGLSNEQELPDVPKSASSSPTLSDIVLRVLGHTSLRESNATRHHVSEKPPAGDLPVINIIRQITPPEMDALLLDKQKPKPIVVEKASQNLPLVDHVEENVPLHRPPLDKSSKGSSTSNPQLSQHAQVLDLSRSHERHFEKSFVLKDELPGDRTTNTFNVSVAKPADLSEKMSAQQHHVASLLTVEIPRSVQLLSNLDATTIPENKTAPREPLNASHFIFTPENDSKKLAEANMHQASTSAANLQTQDAFIGKKTLALRVSPNALSIDTADVENLSLNTAVPEPIVKSSLIKPQPPTLEKPLSTTDQFVSKTIVHRALTRQTHPSEDVPQRVEAQQPVSKQLPETATLPTVSDVAEAPLLKFGSETCLLKPSSEIIIQKSTTKAISRKIVLPKVVTTETPTPLTGPSRSNEVMSQTPTQRLTTEPLLQKLAPLETTAASKSLQVTALPGASFETSSPTKLPIKRPIGALGLKEPLDKTVLNTPPSEDSNQKNTFNTLPEKLNDKVLLSKPAEKLNREPELVRPPEELTENILVSTPPEKLTKKHVLSPSSITLTELRSSAKPPMKKVFEETSTLTLLPKTLSDDMPLSAAPPEEQTQKTSLSTAPPEEQTRKTSLSTAPPEKQIRKIPLSTAPPEEQTQRTPLSTVFKETNEEPSLSKPPSKQLSKKNLSITLSPKGLSDKTPLNIPPPEELTQKTLLSTVPKKLIKKLPVSPLAIDSAENFLLGRSSSEGLTKQSRTALSAEELSGEMPLGTLPPENLAQKAPFITLVEQSIGKSLLETPLHKTLTKKILPTSPPRKTVPEESPHSVSAKELIKRPLLKTLPKKLSKKCPLGEPQLDEKLLLDTVTQEPTEQLLLSTASKDLTKKLLLNKPPPKGLLQKGSLMKLLPSTLSEEIFVTASLSKTSAEETPHIALPQREEAPLSTSLPKQMPNRSSTKTPPPKVTSKETPFTKPPPKGLLKKKLTITFPPKKLLDETPFTASPLKGLLD